MVLKKLTSITTICLILVLSTAFSVWALGADEIDNEDLAVAFYQEVARGEYLVVKTDELKKWMDEGRSMLIVDTMPYEASYKKQHIPGAVQFEFPVPEVTGMEDGPKAEFEKLLGPDKERLLVFYCGFTKCTRSHNGAMWAVKLGYKNVYRCPGGIKGWMQRDFPVEKVQ